MNDEHIRLILIFSIALSLRLFLFFNVGSWNDEIVEKRIVVDDAPGYHNIAVNLLGNNVFSRSKNPPYVPDIFRTPVYPFFLALIYFIFGIKPYAAIFFQLIIGSLNCVLAYKIGEIIFDKKTALLTGLIMAFEYSSILLCNQLLTGTLFIFLFIVHVYFLVRFLKQDNNWDLIYSGIFLGLSTLCRPVSVYFFLFIVGIFFLYFRKNLRTGILRYTILILAFLITIIPWMARNYTVSGKFLVSSVQEKVLGWNMPHLIKLKVVNQQKNEIHNPSPGLSKIRNGHQKMPTKKNIINAALSDIKMYLKGIIRFFMIPGSSGYPNILGLKDNRLDLNLIWAVGPWETVKIAVQEKSVLGIVLMCFFLSFLTILYFTMCFGIYTAIKETKFINVFLFIMIIVYFAIATGPSGFSPRYRAPIMPFIILLSCYGIVKLHIRFNEYKTKRMITMSKI